jgi:hypothetical protein
MKKKNKYIDWLPSGIFSSHYPLERLPQAGTKSGLRRNKLTIDPSNRKTQELLEKHFQKSMFVLAPLKEKIKATDELIDQLYNLTPEEIEVVEGKK